MHSKEKEALQVQALMQEFEKVRCLATEVQRHLETTIQAQSATWQGEHKHELESFLHMSYQHMAITNHYCGTLIGQLQDVIQTMDETNQDVGK